MKHLLKNLLSSFGIKLIKTKYQSVNVKKNHLECFLEILVREGFDPKCVFDIGANHGTWTRRTLDFFPDSRYLLFEPQAFMKASSSDLIEKYDVHFHPFGLGAKSGLFPFTYHDRDDSCSFNIDSDTAELKGWKQELLEVKTVDEFLNESHSMQLPELVKIDAEGLDLEVLKGCSALFGHTDFFLVEGGVGNLEVPNSALAVMQFLEEKGYRFYDLTDLNRPFGNRRLHLVEMVFVRIGSKWDKHGDAK